MGGCRPGFRVDLGDVAGKPAEKIDVVDRRSRLWLWFHVPVSVALTTLICLHVVAWLYYR